MSALAALKWSIFDERKPLSISALGSLVRNALQQIVGRDGIATTCIVNTYGAQIFRIARPIPATSVKQTQPLGPFQQHLHRRRLPACPPAGRALAHRFKSAADRLKRDVWVRALDGSNDGGQAVVSFAAASSGPHSLGEKAVADIGIHGAEQTALRPLALAGQGAVDDP